MDGSRIITGQTRRKVQLLYQCFDLFSLLYRELSSGGVASPEAMLPEDKRIQASDSVLGELTRSHLVEVELGRYRLSSQTESVFDLLNENFADVTPEQVAGNRRRLLDLIEEYRTRQEQGLEEDLESVRREIYIVLDHSIRNVRHNLDKLFRDVNEIYSTEANFTVKKVLLEQNNRALFSLEAESMGLTHPEYVEGLYDIISKELKLDDKLNDYSNYFSSLLNSLWNERSHKIYVIIETYLTKVNKIDKEARKIDKFYELMCEGKLSTHTNLLSGYDSLFYSELIKPRGLPLSLEFDLIPENRAIMSVVKQMGSIESGRVGRQSRRLSRERIEREEKEELTEQAIVDLNIFRECVIASVFESFRSNGEGTELSAFVMSYNDFPETASFFSAEEIAMLRYSIYLEIAVVFGDELVFSEDGGMAEYPMEGGGFSCRKAFLLKKS